MSSNIKAVPTSACNAFNMGQDAVGADYDDFLTLIRIDGQWKVGARVDRQFEG